MVNFANLVDGWLLRLESPNTGLMLEAVEAVDVEDFATYCGGRTAQPPDLSAWSESGRVGLTTWEGCVLEMDYDGAHRVDGKAIDYDAYPLYEAPGVDAPLGTGRMEFRRAGEEMVELDFGVDPQAPLPPMRVIG